MKFVILYVTILMIIPFPMIGSDFPGKPIEVRHSVDHKAEAEGLRGELARTKSYHEVKIKEEKCKSLIAVLTACGSFLGAVGSFIYSVKKCS